MKITLEMNEHKYIVETQHDELALPEFIMLLSGLIRQAGYSFDGELDIVDHSQD